MVVGRDYLLKKQGGPGPSKQAFDTKIVPAAVNMAGKLETLLQRASEMTGLRPSLLLTAGALFATTAFTYVVRKGQKPVSPI